MKHNLVIVLLTAVATLLVVNFAQYNVPTTALAQGSGSAAWSVSCPHYDTTNEIYYCVAVAPNGKIVHFSTWDEKPTALKFKLSAK